MSLSFTSALRHQYPVFYIPFYREGQILTPPMRIETPEPIDKKFCTRDYVCETTQYTKFGENRSTGGASGQIGEI